jgi:hypothetical protein
VALQKATRTFTTTTTRTATLHNNMGRRSSNIVPANNQLAKMNEKGELISWDSKSKDGQLLKVLLEQGYIKKETGSQVQQEYPQFAKYALKTLNSALNNCRKALEKEVDARQSRGSAGEWM